MTEDMSLTMQPSVVPDNGHMHALQDYPWNQNTPTPIDMRHVSPKCLSTPINSNNRRVQSSIYLIRQACKNMHRAELLTLQLCLLRKKCQCDQRTMFHCMYMYCYMQFTNTFYAPSISFIPFLMSFLYLLLMRCQAYVNLRSSVSLFSATLWRQIFS